MLAYKKLLILFIMWLKGNLSKRNILNLIKAYKEPFANNFIPAICAIEIGDHSYVSIFNYSLY